MAAPGRLSGARGSIYLRDSANKLVDSYMWEFEGNQEVAEATTKGENWKRYSPGVGHGRVRIQSFVSTTNQTAVGSLLAGPVGGGTDPPYSPTIVSPLGVGTPIDFILEYVNVSSASSHIVVGQGFVTRAQQHVARDGIITEELDIELDGPVGIN